MKRSKLAPATKRLKVNDEEDDHHTVQSQDSGPTPSILPGGRIKKILLKNFMCHRNFEIKFPCNQNLIVGSNGSGKSAILTAIVIGLGGKATDTKRGNSIKSLITNGCGKGVIEITLGNEGPFKYKEEDFGSEIRIVRTLTEGSSTYKLYSASGKLVSGKKNELHNICHFFRIQVDNPLVILNQDTARTFLKSAKPNQLYQLFCKGTQIEALTEKRDQLLSYQPRIAAMYNQKKEDVSRACREIELMKEKMEKAKELRACEEEAYQTQMEIHWAKVADLKKNKKVTLSKLEEEEKHLEDIENQIKESESIRSTLIDELRALEDKFSSAVEENEKFENLIATEKKSMEEARRKLKILQCAEVESQREEEKLKKTLANYEKVLEKKRAEQGEKQTRMKAFEEEKRKLEIQVEESNAVYRTQSVQQQHLADTLSVETENFSSAQRFYQNLKRQLEHKEQQMNALKRGKSELDVYGSYMPLLVEKLEEAYKRGMLRKMPKGPIGRYLQVSDDWAPALESFLGRKTLCSFCVDNTADLAVVNKIIRQLNIPPKDQPSFTVTKHLDQMHNVTRHETQCQFQNILRSIKISDPVVANVLIDQSSIEKVLMIPTSDEAYPLMDNEENVPRNCKRAITKRGDLFFPAPDYQVYSKQAPPAKFLQANITEILRAATVEIEEIKQKLLEAEEKTIEVKKRRDTARSNLDKAQRETNQLLLHIEKLKKRIDFIANSEMDDQTRGIEVVSKEIDGRTKELETLRRKQEGFQEQRKSLEETIETLHNKVKDLNDKRKEVADFAATGRTAIAKQKEKIGSILSGKITFRKERSLKTIEDWRKKLEKTNEELIKAVREATEACPEIEQPRLLKDLENTLRILTQRKKALQEFLGGSGHDFSISFMVKLEEMENLQTFMEKIKALTIQLSNEINRRSDRLRGMKAVIGAKVNTKFKEFLSLKKFEGKIEVNYCDRELIVSVKPNSIATVSTMDSLSGGERSYSMVSFLLALWNWVDHPFYYIDEFDVFMDDVSRKKSLSLLVSYAKLNPKRQFTFLTPHSIEITKLTSVDVFKMNDPNREALDA